MMPKSREGWLWTPSSLREGLETKAAVPSTRNLKPSYDVVVIGAGFAGLAAARDLSRMHNLKVLIVEARDRIGGRTWTAQAFGEEFEMGGTWIHWNQPHVYSEVHRYNLQSNLKTSAGTAAAEKTFYKAASAPPTEVDTQYFNESAEKVASLFFQIDGMTSRDLLPYPHDPHREPALWKRYDSMTIRQRLDCLEWDATEKQWFESLTNSLGSARGAEIGFTELLRWYALGGHSMAGMFELAGVYKLGKGGTTSLALAMLSDARCHLALGTVVQEITQTASGALVQCQDGKQFQGRAVISTIPLNCLDQVKTSPNIGTLKEQAIKEGHVNKGSKIHFRLAKTEPGWFAACNGDGDATYCFSFSDHNGTKPTGPSGTYCIGFGYNEKLNNPKASDAIIEAFKKDIKPDADVQGYLTHDWANDPYAKGEWSCWGPNAMTKYHTELQRPQGRLYFASGDIADGWRGFIDGALESGKKAASQVVADLDLPHASRLAKL